MKLLLDTLLLIRLAEDSPKLPTAVKELVADPLNQLFFSPASFGELSAKHAVGRGDFNLDPPLFYRALIDNDYCELPITVMHTLAVHRLPAIHADPFDRILVAQAIVEGIQLLTTDETVALYPGPIRLFR
ncbi:type II toxin-antitoxin system VapC family toxin [Rhizobium leguminosarum]|uniref:Twitching motility protein PilT n=2 Tax=Rhizobium leguminosarum TaxID=384 RepID=A0A154ICY6_RHILE|nr:type II toxin-antitoxin system VapC family toxin [Rhizobium leguminosarum]KZA98448.1 twitching motility protein PilT [Rhizobium leguminosarum]